MHAVVRPAALVLSSIAVISAAMAHAPPRPDFGPNVTIIDPSMSVDAINTTLRTQANQSIGFDEIRHAVYFMPGTYWSAAGADTPASATGYVDSPVSLWRRATGHVSSYPP